MFTRMLLILSLKSCLLIENKVEILFHVVRSNSERHNFLVAKFATK